MTEDARITWLRDAITARRDLALSTGPDEPSRTWTGTDNGYEGAGEVSDGHGERVVYDEGNPTTEQALHIAANDPQQVIADCEMQLAIVAWATTGVHALLNAEQRYVLGTVASIYRHHPGYGEYWGDGE